MNRNALIKRVEHLVRIYLNALEQHKAGWVTRSVIADFEEYQGCAPDRPDQWKASDAVFYQTAQLRNEHARLPLAVFLLGKVRLCPCGGEKGCSDCSGFGFTFAGGVLRPHHSLALVARVYYQAETSKQIAEHLGETVSAFSNRLKAARDAAIDELEKIDQLTRLLSVQDEASLLLG